MKSEDTKSRNLTTFGARIREFRTRAGITAGELADALQISKSSVRNWECGLTRPDPGYLTKMFEILDVEPNEFFGTGKKGSSPDPREQALLDCYRSLDSRSRMDLEIFAKALTESAYTRRLCEAFASMTIAPDLGRTAAAGTIGTEWPDHPERDDVILFRSPDVDRADEIITVSGESMEPQFLNGDRVLVEYCSEIRNGDIAIFYVPGVGGVIKQKAYDRLHSLNPEYDDIFPYEDGARLVGRVLGRIQNSMIPGFDMQALYSEALRERAKDPKAFDSFVL